MDTTSPDLMHLHRHAMVTLDSQLGPLQAQYQPYLACRKGCFSCCETQYKIRYSEAVFLVEGFQQAPKDVQEQIRANLRGEGPTPVSYCPVLIEGACSLYEHRPALCRAYGLVLKLGPDLSTCPLNFNGLPRQHLQVLDINPYYELLDELSQRLWAECSESEPAENNVAPNLSIRDYLDRMLHPGSSSSEIV